MMQCVGFSDEGKYLGGKSTESESGDSKSSLLMCVLLNKLKMVALALVMAWHVHQSARPVSVWKRLSTVLNWFKKFSVPEQCR
jgi:hypothetical protein